MYTTFPTALCVFAFSTVLTLTTSAQRPYKERLLVSAVVATPVETPKVKEVPAVVVAPVKIAAPPATMRQLMKPGIPTPGSFTNYLLHNGYRGPGYQGPYQKQGC